MAEEVADIGDQPHEAVQDITKGCFGSVLLFLGFLITTFYFFLIFLVIK